MKFFLRMIFLPISGGVILSLIPILFFPSKYFLASVFYFGVGVLLSVFIGWPVLYVTEKFCRINNFRYVVSGAACSLIIWVFLDSILFGFVDEAPDSLLHWKCLKYAPLRLIAFEIVGVLTGLLYSFFVAVINKIFKKIPK